MEDKKPEIRFKGYTAPWVEEPFSGVFDTISNNTLSRDALNNENGSILNVHYGDVLVKYGEVLDVEKEQIPYIKDTSDVDKFQASFLRDGDLVIADTAEDETVGKCTEISKCGSKKLLSGLHTISCRPKKKYASGFLGYCLNSDNYHHKLLPLMQGIKVTSISKSGLSETSVIYPDDLDEQAAIASLLLSLTQKVKAEEDHYEKLKTIRDTMIEKVFPKPGFDRPEIRFSGFSEAWKPYELGDIANKVTTKNSGTIYTETFTNSAEFGIVSQTDYFDHGISKMENIDGYYIVENNAFVYNPRISTAAPVGPINRNKLGRTGVMSPLYTVFKVHDVDMAYLEWFFKSRIWHSYMYCNGDSGARADRFSIKDDVFFKMIIPLPELKEQVLIGRLLTQLDTLVSLHQEKIEKLKNIRLTCMRKMFV